jgi:hypothetical protein
MTPEEWVDFWERYLRMKSWFEAAGLRVTQEQLLAATNRAREIQSYLERIEDE